MTEADAVVAGLSGVRAFSLRVVAHCYCGRDVLEQPHGYDSRRAYCECGRKWYMVGGETCSFEQWCMFDKRGYRTGHRGTHAFTLYKDGTVAYPS